MATKKNNNSKKNGSAVEIAQVLSDEILAGIIDISNMVDEVSVELDAVMQANEKWLAIASTWQQKISACTTARNEHNKFREAVLQEPNIVDVLRRIDLEKATVQALVRNDPARAAVERLEENVMQLVNKSCEPYRRAIDAAEAAKMEYATYMKSREVAEIKKVADRVAPPPKR